MTRISFVVLLICGLVACRHQQPKQEEQSVTRGRALVLVSDPLEDLVREETEQFTELYPEAVMRVASTTTREAIVNLLNDSVRTICVDRALNDEERNVATKAELAVIENKIAEDALAVIVHPQNPTKQLSLQSLSEILSGLRTRWGELPSSPLQGNIELVLTGRNSGSYELLQKSFFHLSKEIVPTIVVATQDQIVDFVQGHPQALGIVSTLSLARGNRSIRVLALETKDSSWAERYVNPSQMNIYHSLYPLHYSLYLYSTSSGFMSNVGVAAGFTTFVTSYDGQRIIQSAGLVPKNIPFRSIQLNAE